MLYWFAQKRLMLLRIMRTLLRLTQKEFNASMKYSTKTFLSQYVSVEKPQSPGFSPLAAER